MCATVDRMLWVSSSTHASRRADCGHPKWTTRQIVCAASQTQPGDWEDRASMQQPLRAVSGQARWWRRGSDHGAPAHSLDGAPQQWLRWPEAGPARLEDVEPSPPGRHSRPLSSTPGHPTPRSTRTTAAPAHQAGDVDSQVTGPQADALWAIAAALERLADIVAAYLGSLPRDD
jgi:hypothetical protein